MPKKSTRTRTRKQQPMETHALILNEIRKNAAAGATLGHAAAVVIVCACANTSPLNLARTLAELGVDGVSFQGCVFNGVRRAGFTIDIDDIPDSSDTTLIEVVNIIQDASRAE
jgi:hypothetical protein